MPGWLSIVVSLLAGLAGAALLASSIAADSTSLGGSPGFGRGQVLAAALGALLLVLALAHRRAWVIFGAFSVILLCFLVLVAGLDVLASAFLAAGPDLGSRDAGGAMDLAVEGCSFAPFTSWECSPRDTAGTAVRGAPLVVILGGSEAVLTTMGRDCGVAANLDSQLVSRGYAVLNLSEPYFNSMQSLVELAISIADGARPFFVLMLCGPGDVMSAWESGQPYVPVGTRVLMHNADIHAPGDSWEADAQGTGGVIRALASGMSLWKLAAGLMPSLGGMVAETYRPFTPQDVPPTDPAVMATRARRNMEAVCEILRALSRSYGFDYRVAWLRAEARSVNDSVQLYAVQTIVDSLVVQDAAAIPCFFSVGYRRTGLPGDGESGFSGLAPLEADSLTSVILARLPL
ncbi:hypothetical protein GX411_00865 [Candidatus Fermentibacteria bacterium]|nr:hypothetical protein [Candidatus Fermentibacteria bacterium]